MPCPYIEAYCDALVSESAYLKLCSSEEDYKQCWVYKSLTQEMIRAWQWKRRLGK